ncbi:short chain dehydrogenase [Actinoplanes italicus]|uniref:NAD(P)-dependent dehydrogenase (Short-subunit alcohol dehydrogenase family) n=1 Tax=Actinoplanes italicus TaxID=113567 RepID=A0A2T0KER5_9ACTN|nr:short chain dehydrogenase [Actinoplanes italicus]PRX21884.1 NAD(P)-dependent dehydrogenase (short-subunit alcohol dehydrogenase family) [Actinoplanes italicus]GIE29698.1 short chain dehydrogenase [Actinoplanes italicus]
MRILLAGATGTLGTYVGKELAARGHDILAVARRSGDLRYDITDPAQVSAMYERAGRVDAVVSTAGHTPFKAITELTAEDYLAAYRGKVAGQIELVRQGLARIGERGSFTLISGVLAREPIPSGSAASMANGALEAFVRAAAIEIAPQRINAVSPTVFTESLGTYGDYFPGMEPVPLARVAQAYVRSVEGALTGQVFVL